MSDTERLRLNVEVYLSGRDIVLLGSPPHDDEEDPHNCDAMGCGQSHVLARISVHPATERRLRAALRGGKGTP